MSNAGIWEIMAQRKTIVDGEKTTAWSFGYQMLDFGKSTTKKYVFKQAFQEYHSEFVYKLKSTQKIFVDSEKTTAKKGKV